MNPESYIGVWDLDPTTLNYQHGHPGRRAVYAIRAIPGGLEFSLDADDADGKRIQFTYGGSLDGRDKPVPGMRDAALVLGWTADGLIESILKRGGVVVDRWTREVLPDRSTMRIIQWGHKSDGSEFQNLGLYRR
jgi:hypothetical protein